MKVQSLRRTLLGSSLAVTAIASLAIAQSTSVQGGGAGRGRSFPWEAGSGAGVDSCRDVINFRKIPNGTILTQVQSNTGLGPFFIQGSNPFINAGATNAAIIFNTAFPTGLDFDLGTPHMDFGGPGVGDGGKAGAAYENNFNLGKAMILGENLNDANNDGLVDDPDDANVLGIGGSLTIDFSAFGEVYIESMVAIDLDLPEDPLTVDFFKIGGALLATHVFPHTGNNGGVREFLGYGPVGKMVINVTGSGAFDDIVFECWEDCNDNGIQDSVDIGDTGDSDDCNLNGIPDECDLSDNPADDCNGNGILDECDIADGTSQDCNLNGIPDECEMFDDCNCNGIPDECEPDCNGNDIPDECDIADGTSQDCNDNGIPDECDIAGGGSDDVNGDGIPDECCIFPPDDNTSIGLYRLHNATGLVPGEPPEYGLRLDGLFGDPANDYTFSFDEPGTAMFMRYDGVKLEIWGTAYGGLDIGLDWDPVVQSFVTLDYVYEQTQIFADELQVPDTSPASGTIVWENDNTVIPLDPVALNGLYFHFLDNLFGQGWLAPNGSHINTQDWLFLGEPIIECVPEDEPIDCNGNGIYDVCDIANGDSLDANMNGIPDECE